mmetsp:Transcript_1429/g.1599  ORF Transcript_1429/g.1599 Transcript_1429/m.1599 type:complete len:327 (-) Transcript_1429:125-1105(-)
MIRAVSYNVFGGGEFKEERLELIVGEIVKQKPDIVCLQEVTKEIVTRIKADIFSNFGYTLFSWTKREAYKEIQETLTAEKQRKLEASGYLAILSRWPIAEKELVYTDYLDDGILKCSVEIDSISTLSNRKPKILVYNVHLRGGSYGKPAEVLASNREKRKDELESLNSSLICEINKHKVLLGNKTCLGMVIMGDFNSCCYDLDNFPETEYYPENRLIPLLEHRSSLSSVIKNLQCIDVWNALLPDVPCYTESCSMNKLRSYLKPNQSREAKFDKVVLCSSKSSLKAASIKLIGNDGICKIKDEEGKEVELFPSDHFGLAAVFQIEK